MHASRRLPDIRAEHNAHDTGSTPYGLHFPSTQAQAVGEDTEKDESKAVTNRNFEKFFQAGVGLIKQISPQFKISSEIKYDKGAYLLLKKLIHRILQKNHYRSLANSASSSFCLDILRIN